MNFTSIANAKKMTGLSYLGNTGISSKIIKGEKVNNVLTYSLYLSPDKTSGYNVCPFSTVECRLGCLATSGRTAVEIYSNRNIIQNARIKKTRLFFENQDYFMGWLVAEIESARLKSIKKNMGFAVRLNCTSDIDWQNILFNGKNVFEHFPQVQFYDYTKNPQKFNYLAENYHLTFSYNGRNWDTCKSLLDKGYNIAMIFSTKKNNSFPVSHKGYSIIDGDLTDYRVADPKGTIVGLRWKKIADKNLNDHIKESIFVMQV